MLVQHIATREDWESALRSGAYQTSTVGRTLDQEGFLHASRPDQAAGVFERYYRALGAPLVLLSIETELLDVPWRLDPVGDDTYPHIYGPLSPAAVVSAEPLDPDALPWA